MTGGQILDNPLVWYSNNILSMIKMIHHNIIQHGTQTTGLSMICRFSLDCKNEGYDHHSTNVGCTCFRYTKDGFSDHTNQGQHHSKWIRENVKLGRCCYFMSNPAKRMIEITKGCTRFPIINQRLADQVMTITKNGWLSDFELLEILQQIKKEAR